MNTETSIVMQFQLWQRGASLMLSTDSKDALLVLVLISFQLDKILSVALGLGGKSCSHGLKVLRARVAIRRSLSLRFLDTCLRVHTTRATATTFSKGSWSSQVVTTIWRRFQREIETHGWLS